MRDGLTRNETEVLALLRAADGPLTAYQLLNRMQHGNGAVAPPTVYRALKGLEDAGLVRKIETLRAWAAVKTDASGVVVICDDCGTVRTVTAPNLFETLHQSLEAEGFTEARQTIEVHGSCSDCTHGASGGHRT
jgi:Fur family zinc uptake transcriptional regulator